MDATPGRWARSFGEGLLELGGDGPGGFAEALGELKGDGKGELAEGDGGGLLDCEAFDGEVVLGEEDGLDAGEERLLDCAIHSVFEFS